MNEIIFFVFLSTTMIIAFNLFALESNNPLSLQSIVGICVLICLLPLNFAYCYFADIVTANLYEIGDIFYNIAWYQLPVQMQIFLVLPIQRTGKRFRFQSLGIIDCSLAVFLSVGSI